jgi:hypothetical protein
MKNAIAALLILISTDLFAQCDGQTQAVTSPQNTASTSGARVSLDLAFEMAQIKSPRDLSSFMKLKDQDKNPLMLLSNEARARFLDSLTFNENGLTGYKYTELEYELTPTQIARILKLFGAQGHINFYKKAQVKTAKDRRLLNGDLNPALVDCGAGEEGGDYPIGGGVTTNPQGPPLPPSPGPYPPGPITPQDYKDYKCAAPSECKYSKGDICMKAC